MPSAWIERRPSGRGTRYRVKFRAGGREAMPRYAGSFATRKEALLRKQWVEGELAAMRIPDVTLVEPKRTETLRCVFEVWRESRIDVDEATAITYRTSQERVLAAAGDVAIDKLDVAWVAGLVAALHEKRAARESIRKTRAHLAMALDFAGVTPNPARAKAVKLPPDERVEVVPPTAEHMLGVFGILTRSLRLPLLVLDATGMRVGELAAIGWGDVDEPAHRWRVSQAIAKTRKARWVPVPADVFEAVVDLAPREDRDLEAPVFAGFNADRLRTAISRACKVSGVPVFSPHDVRHRRATLWHLQGVPAAEAAAWLGHSPQEHLATYAHATLVDRAELEYGALLEDARPVHPPVNPAAAKVAV